MTQKICLVTGAASGIGFGVAEKFASEAYKVLIADINLEGAEQAAAKINAKNQQAQAYRCDVSSASSVQELFQQIKKDHNRLDVLVSNAGVQRISSMYDFTLQDWQTIIDIHLTGSFLMAQQAMLMMREQKYGRIVFVGSVHSSIASKNKAAYVAAKHGMKGLMRAIAQEGAPFQIAANLIGPGFVKTPLVEKQIPEQAKTLGISEAEVVSRVMLGQTVDGEFTTVADIADTCYFFGSFPTLALTGQSLLITHGWQME